MYVGIYELFLHAVDTCSCHGNAWGKLLTLRFLIIMLIACIWTW